MRAPELWFGEVAQQKLRLEDPTQIPVVIVHVGLAYGEGIAIGLL